MFDLPVLNGNNVVTGHIRIARKPDAKTYQVVAERIHRWRPRWHQKGETQIVTFWLDIIWLSDGSPATRIKHKPRAQLERYGLLKPLPLTPAERNSKKRWSR